MEVAGFAMVYRQDLLDTGRVSSVEQRSSLLFFRCLGQSGRRIVDGRSDLN
jgi:hypothetical protein